MNGQETHEQAGAEGTKPRLSRQASAIDLPGAALPGGRKGSLITLGWGYPDPVVFPTEGLLAALSAGLGEDGEHVLQYGGGRGAAMLRAWLSRHLAERGVTVAPEQVLLSGGSTAAFDWVCRLFVDPGDVVWTEDPSYYGALRVFGLDGAQLRGIPSDGQGIDPDRLEAALRTASTTGRLPKFLYTVPSYQNPTGELMPLARRRRLVELAAEYDFFIVEDDAYAELWFEEPTPPPLKALAPERVILLGTFSKLIAPAVRLGWVLPPQALISPMTQVQGGGGYNPIVVEGVGRWLEATDFAAHLCTLRAHYRARRDLMEEALRRELSGAAQWQTPGGGFFYWLTFVEGLDSDLVLGCAKERGVDFVGGRAFRLGRCERDNQARLCFSFADSEQIGRGIGLLRAALTQAEAKGALR